MSPENVIENENRTSKVIHVRAHHIWRTKNEYATLFLNALGGNIDHSAIIEHISHLGVNDSEYREDVFADIDENFSDVFDKRFDYYMHLADLKNTDILSIGVAKDGICESCIIGKHCLKRFITKDDKTIDIVEEETSRATALLTIISASLPFELTEGRDFKWVKEIVPLEVNNEIVDTEVDQLEIRVGLVRQAFKLNQYQT